MPIQIISLLKYQDDDFLKMVGVRVVTQDKLVYDIPMGVLAIEGVTKNFVYNLPSNTLKDYDGRLITKEEYTGQIQVQSKPPYSVVKELQILINQNLSKEPYFPIIEGKPISNMQSRFLNDMYGILGGASYWRKHEQKYKEYYKPKKKAKV